LVKRIRQVTGQADPDEDPNNPSPETIERQKQAAQAAQMQQRAAEAELGEKEAKTAKLRMETARGFMGLRTDNLEQLKKAVEAAIQIAGAPAVAGAVDQMIALAHQDALSLGEAAQGGTQPQPTTTQPQLPEAGPAEPEALPAPMEAIQQ
ncbi:MAG: hypothetical protein Q4G26_16705, partial [Paracoccus sp. (in: a-proteobacteria)]|nr:hypothetical protein [Paracoccus sp. (in: a-proteobacteria)]